MCPENIYITQSGKWKIAGLIFRNPCKDPTLVHANIDFTNRNNMHPNLSYIAPELIMSMPQQACYKSDLFSFGILLANLLKYKSNSKSHESCLYQIHTPDEYKNSIQTILQSIPR